MRNNADTIRLLDTGENYSFEQCFDQMYAALCTFANKFSEDENVSEDIVQDIFIKLWQNFNSFDSVVAIKVFLYQSVRNACLNYLEHLQVKDKYRKHQLSKIESEKYFLDELIEIETHRIIHQAILQLPQKCRQIMILNMEGLTNPEIADYLKISVNTVKTQKAIAYNHLRKKLKTVYMLASWIIPV